MENLHISEKNENDTDNRESLLEKLLPIILQFMHY
uniref:Uncharacterized protein n=1 Tax=Ascaris lumbricoides TaxID=6252 RepID=A0A0M3IWF2_ASCLU